MEDKHHWKDLKHKADIFLQMLLCFNVNLSILWMFLFGYYFIKHVSYMDKIEFLLTCFSYAISLPADLLRLYLGYSGNLQGKIADLVGFWIITTLIQLPIHVYLTYSTYGHLILGTVQCLILLLIILEIPFGIYASRKLATYQSQLHEISKITVKTENNGSRF